jgi:uncharacterized protein (TIGR00266 family)
MHCEIQGKIAQTATLTFNPGESAWASKGSLMSYGPGIEWTLKVPGGLAGAFRRSLAGEGVALTLLEAPQGGTATLAANQPGHIIEWDLATQGPVITTRGAFLAAWGPDIDITVTTARRAGAALFGGAGLFLQRISGTGTVLVHGSGDFVDHDLKEGEELRTSTGNLAAFAEAVDYDIERVGGLKKTLFGSEGLFMTRLRGPGRVLLQTLKRTAAGRKGGPPPG